MPNRLAAAAAGALLATALVLGAPAPAHALECALHPLATPEAIATGTEQLVERWRFFDLFDFAVVGTVTAVRTDEAQGSPTYGATEIDVRVHGVFGVDRAPDVITLRAADPGWMAGWPFQPGAAYFIPVVARSPEGITNWTHGCDPVTELAPPGAAPGDVEARTASLAELATGSGIAFSVPGPPSSGPRAASGGWSWFTGVISVAAVASAAALVLVLRRSSIGRRLPVRDLHQRVERPAGRT